jgi:nuclear GTP-binding protein
MAMASTMSRQRARISIGTLTLPRSDAAFEEANAYFYCGRDAKKLKTLSMYKEGKAQRNASGKVTKAASYQSRELPKARVEPNRKWFGNTRVISQNALDSFRSAVAERASDPYQVLLKTNKLPMSLIRDAENTTNGVRQHQAKIAVESAPFSDTFGPKSQRKRVKLDVGSLEDMAGSTVKMHESYQDILEEKRLLSGHSEKHSEQNVQDGELTTAREPIFSKGQSKRIWNELYKVIDSSDVVIHVLDARDPEGTRCRSVEKYIREEVPHKHLVFVLNKCDLVPTTVAVS